MSRVCFIQYCMKKIHVKWCTIHRQLPFKKQSALQRVKQSPTQSLYALPTKFCHIKIFKNEILHIFLAFNWFFTKKWKHCRYKKNWVFGRFWGFFLENLREIRQFWKITVLPVFPIPPRVLWAILGVDTTDGLRVIQVF